MVTGDRFWTATRKRDAVNIADASGRVGDGMVVRNALMMRVKSGEISLMQAQEELKRIKSNVKKNGQITRRQAFSRG